MKTMKTPRLGFVLGVAFNVSIPSLLLFDLWLKGGWGLVAGFFMLAVLAVCAAGPFLELSVGRGR